MGKKRRLIIGVTFLLLCILSACNLPSAGGDADLSVEELAATYQQQTLNAQASGEEDGSDDAVIATSTATETLTPTLTLTPTITLTPTLEKPMVSVSVDTNCRTGPGKIYDWIGALLTGEQAQVVGQSMDGQYWIIKNPDRAGECWLWGNYATVKGPTDALPKYTPPPTPTPAFNWEGAWTTYNVDPGGMWSLTYSMTISVNGKNFTGVVDLGGGDVIDMSGTISDDNLTVSGNWTSPWLTGTFEFFALGANQYQGNGDNGTDIFGWCGSRSGAGQPSPCLKN